MGGRSGAVGVRYRTRAIGRPFLGAVGSRGKNSLDVGGHDFCRVLCLVPRRGCHFHGHGRSTRYKPRIGHGRHLQL